MTTQRGVSSDEARIRALLDEQAEATRAKHADRFRAVYAAELLTFDMAPPLRNAGADVALSRENLEGWFDTWQGPIGYETRDLNVTVGGDVAFSHDLIHISGTKVTGEHDGVWARRTLGLRRIDGAWKIVHEHTSVPFYMDGSYRAAVDLEP